MADGSSLSNASGGAGGKRPYHHGALREALLEASERILDRDGINGLTLRAAAREAGASHAAPKNHFGDLAGLLSELAALGFRRFSFRLEAAARAAKAPEDRGRAIGKAYVHFAIDHPGLFLLMFRGERLDFSRPSLQEAMDAATAVLAQAAGSGKGGAEAPQALARAGRMVAAWSLVHGFAMLLIDGRLAGLLSHMPGTIGIEALLDEVLGGGR
ncbi:MAG: hypothetical protein BGN87_21595 [Rhizobiales bacterium 65-79]|jgi:AcrR family transcriptional regulator|nr:TetR/AcrR family transcriptional regulator [Hyphomicrobiales bacterium]OJU04109.1 MAG: hypothetical protein BGN87_21595 [Rhizobiales bacterium 65-79]